MEWAILWASYSSSVPAFCLALVILYACLPRSEETAISDPGNYKLPNVQTLKDKWKIHNCSVHPVLGSALGRAPLDPPMSLPHSNAELVCGERRWVCLEHKPGRKRTGR